MTRRNESGQIGTRGGRGFGARGFSSALVVVLVSGGMLGLGGCEKPPPPPPPPAPAPPPPPPPPEPVNIEAIMQREAPDARVQFPEAFAPTSETLATGIIRFADRLARGDSDGVRGMLSPDAAADLDALADSGQWESGTGRIEAVRIVGVSGDESAAVVNIAIQEPGSAYVLSWAVAPGPSGLIFSALPSTGATKTRASEWDGQNVAPPPPPAAIPEPTPGGGTSPSGGGGGEGQPVRSGGGAG